MNLDQEETKTSTAGKKEAPKKLSRKEKKALKKAEKEQKAAGKKADNPAGEPPPAKTVTRQTPTAPQKAAAPVKKESKSEEVEARLDPSPIPEIPPPKYTVWEKISPPARRKKQITNMESGYREVLGLVHSMRNNQEVLLDAFKKLPEAVESVKKLADHSAQQSDLLKAMNEQMSSGAAGDINKTLGSMDQTTQLLLERAQRSEERLYGILRQAQRRIAFMTLLVLLLFLAAVAAVMFVVFPEKTQNWLDRFSGSKAPETEVAAPASEPEQDRIDPVMPEENDTSPIDPAPSGELLDTLNEDAVNAMDEPIALPDPSEDEAGENAVEALENPQESNAEPSDGNAGGESAEETDSSEPVDTETTETPDSAEKALPPEDL